MLEVNLATAAQLIATLFVALAIEAKTVRRLSGSDETVVVLRRSIKGLIVAAVLVLNLDLLILLSSDGSGVRDGFPSLLLGVMNQVVIVLMAVLLAAVLAWNPAGSET